MKLQTVFTAMALLLYLVGYGQQTSVAINGALQVKDNQLCNKYGHPVQLRGVSSHGLQWHGNCITSSSIAALRDDWGADIVRLALYVEEGGYLSDKNGWKATVKDKADAIISAGLYVIIDWHILQDGDPRQNQSDAEEFFGYMSDLYAGVPNVIYEICNEPNGNGDDGWSTAIKPYAESVIPIIRANSPDAIVLVGTPKWSSKIGDIVADPLTGDNAKNVLYSFHFYSGSHFTQAYVNKFTDQLPIFADEWGTSSYSGNDLFNTDNASDWLELFAGNNLGKQKISWCNWSFSDKPETSAALQGGSCYGGNWNATTESGTYIKSKLSEPDNFITGLLTEPKISVHPFSATVPLGGTTQLTVSALGAGLNYQWYRNGNEITGATDDVLQISDVNASDYTNYSVLVTNSYGSTESQTAELSQELQASSVSDTVFIPGIVEAEQFDEGGEGIAFHDLDDAVAIDGGIDGGSAITGSQDNEWIEYTIYAKNDANVIVQYVLNNSEESPKIYLAVDGVAATPIFRVPETADWDTVGDGSVFFMRKGTHMLRLIFENGENNGTLAIDNIIFKEVDCNGDENGTALYDQCGICSGGLTGITPAEDSDGDGVYDCDDGCPNDPNKTEPGSCGCLVAEGQCDDCNGDFGGTAFIDNCDVCAGGLTGITPNTSCFDCHGDRDGTAEIDHCGICAGGLTGIEPDSYCTDCAGILNGTADIDSCGICAGGTTGIVPNTVCLDCNGDLNGTALVDECGMCGGDGTSCAGVLTPYKGVRAQIPGKVEAEEFDAGGADIAYSDTDAGNNGEEFRDSDVDISDEATGYCIGWTSSGEYVKYSVSIKYTGLYTVVLYAGTPDDGKTITCSIGGQDIEIDVANTGSYKAFDSTIVENIALDAGDYVLEFTFNDGGVSYDYLEFIPEFFVDCNGEVDGLASIDDCGVCAGGNTGVEPNTVCADCAGVVNGSASVDDCGFCSGGTTGKEKCFVQQLHCDAGWNLISTYLIPLENQIPAFFGSASANINIVKNDSLIYNQNYPSYINSLSQITAGTGYFVYCQDPVDFNVSGYALEIENNSQYLSAGWNVVGFSKADPEYAHLALSSIWENVEQIKDFDSFYHYPDTGNPFTLIPGKAYYVYVTKPCILYW